MAPVDAINMNNPFMQPYIDAIWGGSAGRVGKTQQPQQTPKVGGVQPQGVDGYVAEKWVPGLSGIPTGALGMNARHDRPQLGKEGYAGARLNVDTFSLADAYSKC